MFWKCRQNLRVGKSVFLCLRDKFRALLKRCILWNQYVGEKFRRKIKTPSQVSGSMPPIH